MRSFACLIALAGASAIVGCAHDLDGPTPVVDEVVPDLVCTAQDDITIEIHGSGFSPVVIGALTDDPQVEMPRVFLIGEDGIETEVPAAGVSVPDDSGTVLDVVIPLGLVGPTDPTDPAIVYDVRVANPNGNESTLADGLTVEPPPELLGIDPTSGAVGETVVVTLTGNGFSDGMTVTLDADPIVNGADVAVTSSTSATATFDLTGVAPGVYDVTVTNPGGCSSTLEGAFTVYQPHDIAVTGIDPPFGCTCSPTTVTISGAAGFVSTPRVQMRLDDGSGPVIDFERVAFVDASTLTAVVPAGAAIGVYDVTVLNPPTDGGIGTLDMGFRVVSMEIPTIEEVVPARGDGQGDTPVSIYGENFRDPVKVELIDRLGAVVGTVASTTPISSTQIDVTLPTTGLADDAYLIRVTDLDEDTYSTWSAFIVGATGPSGNLHAFTDATAMVTGRRMLAGVSARDDLGNTYLYAIGGDTGAAGTTLATVEHSQLSKFGSIGAWSDNGGANPMQHARRGLAAVTVPIFDPAGSPFVPVKTYVYVIGGRDDTGTVRDDVERAMVLRAADAPVITSIGSGGVGDLDAGTWYYKVSAVLDAGDPENPGGETLASDEAIRTIGGGTGAITLDWDAVTVNGVDAASYRIYRTDAVDGASQQEHLIAEVTDTTYTDTGDDAGTEPPLTPGSLGVWSSPAGIALTTPRWGHQAAVTVDSTGARFLHVVGGKSDDATGYLGDVEIGAIDADGDLADFSGTGTSSMTPRAWFSLAVETSANATGFTGVARFIATGGVGSTGTANKALDTVEISDVADAGGNAPWTDPSLVLQIRAGLQSVIVGEKLFCLGGTNSATDTTFAASTGTGRDIGFDPDDGTLVSPMQNAAQTLVPARALGVGLAGAGFIYLFGGTSTGTDALNSVVQSF